MKTTHKISLPTIIMVSAFTVYLFTTCQKNLDTENLIQRNYKPYSEILMRSNPSNNAIYYSTYKHVTSRAELIYHGQDTLVANVYHVLDTTVLGNAIVSPFLPITSDGTRVQINVPDDGHTYWWIPFDPTKPPVVMTIMLHGPQCTGCEEAEPGEIEGCPEGTIDQKCEVVVQNKILRWCTGCCFTCGWDDAPENLMKGGGMIYKARILIHNGVFY